MTEPTGPAPAPPSIAGPLDEPDIMTVFIAIGIDGQRAVVGHILESTDDFYVVLCTDDERRGMTRVILERDYRVALRSDETTLTNVHRFADAWDLIHDVMVEKLGEGRTI